ncbi:MAG: LLM class flavin-dependent oxidoreductase, partial [Thaumarchaeota archaeon]|nr:LLM class flavin-dependent oxidoreductase [Nitrososphaerota archaeon]
MSRTDFHIDLGENYYDPARFVEATVFAEELGFKTVWLGDHFVPWFDSGKRSSFVWSVMSVALERTSTVRVGPFVTTPIGARYPPAIIAQASATIDNMYPGRFILGVGSGEALNEAPFWNSRWPAWQERIDRLCEGVDLIRKLWESKEPFGSEGKYFSSDFYFLYTKPRRKIPIYFSAIGKRAAFYAGKYSDHLVTLSPRNNASSLKEEIIPSFYRGLREANKRNGQVLIHLSFSLSKPEKVFEASRRKLGWMMKDSWSIRDPVQSEELSEKNLTIEDLKRGFHFCRNWKELIKIIEGYKEVGVNSFALFSEASRKKMKLYSDNI